MKSPKSLLVKRLSLGSLGGVLVFVVLVLVLHVINPQMSPVSVPISAYVAGHEGFLMTIAFLARGLGELLLVAGLALGTMRSSRPWAGLVLLTLAMLCTFLVAIFPGLVAPFVPGGFQNTSALALHSASALLGFSSLALSALFWSARLRHNPRWRKAASVSFLLGLLMLLSLLGFLAKGFLGLAERLLEIFIVCWLSFMASRLFAQSLASSEETSPLAASSKGNAQDKEQAK